MPHGLGVQVPPPALFLTLATSCWRPDWLSLLRRALSIVGLVFALLLDSGCAENKTSSANRELEVIPASHRALEWQNRFDRWVTSHQSEVRDLQRELAEIHSDDSAEGEQLSFSLSHFAYFTRVERGYAQPLLVRRKLNSALHEYETVTSPGFGSNGYPFLLQRFAICSTLS